MNGLFTDCYELTMANSDFLAGKQDVVGNFDLFFRELPANNGYAVCCGLGKIIEDISNLKFSAEDIRYLKENFGFCDEYLTALENFKFQCSIKAVPEGTVVFPHEPLVTVQGPMWQAMLVEVVLLSAIGHQTLVATKAARIKSAAKGKEILEFGARRAHGHSAALYGARAAYIGGAEKVSLVEAGAKFGLPVSGTMGHSFIQKYGNDYDAFLDYAKAFPDSSVFLIDTYNVINSGLPATIRVNNEFLKPIGEFVRAVRIDSGDLGYLSKKVRKILDENGMTSTKIIVSNSLDEYSIRDLIVDQKAPIDLFGVGEKLITSSSSPVLGVVYKLSATSEDGKEFTPCIKIAENHSKTTTPSIKMPYRLFDKATGKAFADVIAMHDEKIDEPFELIDPRDNYNRKTAKNFVAKPLLEDVFINGELVYKSPDIKEIKEYAEEQISTLWDEVKRFSFPHNYYVDLSPKLLKLKQNMIAERIK